MHSAGPRIHCHHGQQMLLHPDYRALVSSHLYATIYAKHGQPCYPLQCIGCYTLNTTGSEFGYGPGRKVSETSHTVLGRHPETGQPTLSGLGSGRPTLQHRRIPGQVPAQTGKAQVLPQRKTTLVVIIRTSNRKETGTEGVASLGRGIGAGLFPEARPRGTTPRVWNRCIVADGSKAQGDTVAPRGQEKGGMMLPLASSSLTPDYGDELWALPAHDSVSVSPTYPGCLQRL